MEEKTNKSINPLTELDVLNDEPITLCNKIIKLSLNDSFASKLEDENSYESKIFNLALQYLDTEDSELKKSAIYEQIVDCVHE